ncbi:signal peptidase I [Streptomyces sp. NPDC006733]|uniref:signal peptidase I n=1 Tax=Streptomyces sp. NPDC006733 TaxID=3155460 RepID=UPI0033C98D62
MDTDAGPSERDRSSTAEQQGEQRSRFAVSPSSVPPWWSVARWWRTAVPAVACVAALFVVNAFLVQPFLVPSGSMEGTLHVGDRVLVNKLAYRFGRVPERGDIVVFDGDGSFLQTGGTDYVKRVIGVGGDRVTCCDALGRLMVNGHSLDEAYLYPGNTPSRVPFDIRVPAGRLWVMGDHRDDSRDSRDHLGEPGGGTVPLDEVIGRADWIGWPIGRMRSLDRPEIFAAVPGPGRCRG